MQQKSQNPCFVERIYFFCNIHKTEDKKGHIYEKDNQMPTTNLMDIIVYLFVLQRNKRELIFFRP